MVPCWDLLQHYFDILCLHLYFELPVFGLRLVGGGSGRGPEGGAGARQGAKISKIDVFLKKPSRDPVGTQSGPSRDPIGHQFLHFFLFFVFGCFPTLGTWIPSGSRRDPDWIHIDRQERTPAPIFPFPDPPLPLFSFSAHQPCTNTPPPAPKRQKQS